MPSFSVSIPAGSRVLYLAHSSDESNDSVGVELAPHAAALTHLPVDRLADVGSVPADSFDFVLARPSLGYSPAFVASILRALRPGGSFVAHVPQQSSGASVQTQLVLGGFVDVVATPRDAAVTEVVAQRPPWNVNASAPLKLKKKAPAPTPAPAPSTKAVWNLAASDMNELDDDLADEDELLAKDTFVAPAPRVAADCGPGAGPTKKACKNCSCGLAEEQAAGGGAADPSAPAAPSKLVSACGSCGLGDAFRCSGCPFLGKPAFTMAPTGAVKLQL